MLQKLRAQTNVELISFEKWKTLSDIERADITLKHRYKFHWISLNFKKNMCTIFINEYCSHNNFLNNCKWSCKHLVLPYLLKIKPVSIPTRNFCTLELIQTIGWCILFLLKKWKHHYTWSLYNIYNTYEITF